MKKRLPLQTVFLTTEGLPFSVEKDALPAVIFRINGDIEMILIPFVCNLMLVRSQGIEKDFICLAALIDAVIGDIDFIAIFMGIKTAGMVAAFGTASDDEGNPGLTGFRIQPIQKGNGRALEMNRIGRAIAVPRRIHAFRAAPLTKIALAKVAAIGVGIGNGRIVRIMLVLVLVLIFVFLAVPTA